MDALFSKTIRAGNKTYFIHVKEAKNKSKYISIAESQRSKEEEGKFSTKTILVFDNNAQKFRDALDEAISYVNKK